MKRRTSGLLLSLLMLMSLTACGGEVQGSASVNGYYSTSGGLIDLPVQEPEDGSLPDEGQNAPDSSPDLGNGSQGKSDEDNRPDGKSSGGSATVTEGTRFTSKRSHTSSSMVLRWTDTCRQSAGPMSMDTSTCTLSVSGSYPLKLELMFCQPTQEAERAIGPKPLAHRSTLSGLVRL